MNKNKQLIDQSVTLHMSLLSKCVTLSLLANTKHAQHVNQIEI